MTSLPEAELCGVLGYHPLPQSETEGSEPKQSKPKQSKPKQTKPTKRGEKRRGWEKREERRKREEKKRELDAGYWQGRGSRGGIGRRLGEGPED